jgi:ribonuclease HI
VVKELSRYLGHTTNNVAEYEGFLMGLEALLQLGKKRICVQSDSQLLVRQLNGEYRVKDEKLRRFFKKPSHYCVGLRRIVSFMCLGK